MRGYGAALIKARFLEFTTARDPRGLLIAGQFPGNLPFTPERFFLVTESPPATERGGHAHRHCHQVLIGTVGVVRVEFDDDSGTHVVALNSPTRGLYVPPLVWAKQTYVSDGASLVVFASLAYDVNDYIDDRDAAARLRHSSRHLPRDQ